MNNDIKATNNILSGSPFEFRKVNGVWQRKAKNSRGARWKDVKWTKKARKKAMEE